MDRSIYTVAERLRRGTRNEDIIAVCDALLELRVAREPEPPAPKVEVGIPITKGVCPECARRRALKAAAQKRWRRAKP